MDHPKKAAGFLIAAAILSGGFAAGMAPAAADPSVACAASEKSSMVKTGEEDLAVGAIVASSGCSGA